MDDWYWVAQLEISYNSAPQENKTKKEEEGIVELLIRSIRNTGSPAAEGRLIEQTAHLRVIM